MASIIPFRALRYDPNRVPDLSAVVAPPYDVISPEAQEALHARNPYNAVRLVLPKGEAIERGDRGERALLESAIERGGDQGGEDRYARAARDFAAWRREGVLARDEEPAFYLVEDRYRVRDASGRETERRRLGLLCLARIEAYEARVILPHERTLAAPRDDRFRLMRAVNAQLSPVFMLAPDPDGRFAELCAKAAGAEPLAEFENGDARHRLVRVEGGAVRALQETLRDRPLLIADGHHRYETARAYRDWRVLSETAIERGGRGERVLSETAIERGGSERTPSATERDGRGERVLSETATERTVPGERPYDYVMVLIASMDDPGTTVLGYHRAVRETGLEAAALRARLAGKFEVEPAGRLAEEEGRFALLSAMARADGAGRTAFGVALRGDPELLLVSRARDASAPPLARLDVSVLHGEIFGGMLGMTEEDFRQQRRVDYTADAAKALAMVRDGSHAAAFLLNPTPPAAVLAVAQAGQVMPQKSTYFYPKLLTGLTFHAMD